MKKKIKEKIQYWKFNNIYLTTKDNIVIESFTGETKNEPSFIGKSLCNDNYEEIGFAVYKNSIPKLVKPETILPGQYIDMLTATTIKATSDIVCMAMNKIGWLEKKVVEMEKEIQELKHLNKFK